MTSIDDKIPRIHLSEPDDDRYLKAISKYTSKDRLSIAERQVLTMIKVDMEERYSNYEDSRTCKAIGRALERRRIGIMSVPTGSDYVLSRDLTTLLFDLEPSGILSSAVESSLSGRIDEINRGMYPEYFLDK
jgi:hypothetical protein